MSLSGHKYKVLFADVLNTNTKLPTVSVWISTIVFKQIIHI